MDIEDARAAATPGQSAAMPGQSAAMPGQSAAMPVPLDIDHQAVRNAALFASSSSASLRPSLEGEQKETPTGVQHSLGRASYMLHEQPVRRVGGQREDLDLLKQCWKAPADGSTLNREVMVLMFVGGCVGMDEALLNNRLQKLCVELGAYYECLMFKQEGHFVLIWKSSLKGATTASGYRQQSYKCPMKALEQALSDQRGASIVPHLPILACGKGGKGRNDEHKAAALACISELFGEGFATFQFVDVQPPRSYTHEELIPLIRD